MNLIMIFLQQYGIDCITYHIYRIDIPMFLYNHNYSTIMGTNVYIYIIIYTHNPIPLMFKKPIVWSHLCVNPLLNHCFSAVNMNGRWDASTLYIYTL